MEFPETKSINFSIQTEISSTYMKDLLMFIYRQYVVPFYIHFTNVRQWAIDGKPVLAFTLNDTHGLWYVNVQILMGNPIDVKMAPSVRVPQKILSRLKEDLIITVQMFEEKVRRTTLYFAWVPRKGVVLEKTPDRRRKVLGKIFMGNMIVFFIVFLVFSYAIFLAATELFGVPLEYFPIILVAVQFVMVLFSHKIVGTMGNWSITASNPYVHILQYHIPPEQFRMFRQNYKEETLLKIKKEIYDRTFHFDRPIDSLVAQEAFSNYGINIKPENLLTKTINVYRIVKEAARRFNMPIPRITISNVIVPNAAATGPSPRFGLVLLTTGLLVQLDEEEILAVVGHEMSHVTKRDPLALFVLASVEYLLRVYYFWALFYYFGIFYFFLEMGILFFIAKFFEARADLESAVKLGRPEVLAGALRKIGYKKIQLERMSSNRIGSWLGWNPHPPLSFRVERLENLKNPNKIRHPFVQSVKDCMGGLLVEIRRSIGSR